MGIAQRGHTNGLWRCRGLNQGLCDPGAHAVTSSLQSSCTLRGCLLHPSVSHRSHRTEPGLVLTLGQGDVGQLGLGENVMERKKPALVPIPEDIVQAEAGGMHTVCLSKSGQVGGGWHGIGQGLGFGEGASSQHTFLYGNGAGWLSRGWSEQEWTERPDLALMGHPAHRSTPLAATMRVPWEGTRQWKAQRWFPGKWNCKRRWCKCQQETVTQQPSPRMAVSSSGAPSG